MRVGILAMVACLSITGCSMVGLDAQKSFTCKAPPGINCSSLSGVYANAVADNLPAVGRQIIVLKEAQDFVQKFEVSNITLTGSGVTFSLELILRPNVFYLGK